VREDAHRFTATSLPIADEASDAFATMPSSLVRARRMGAAIVSHRIRAITTGHGPVYAALRSARIAAAWANACVMVAATIFPF
jgi:hypothetical protein